MFSKKSALVLGSLIALSSHAFADDSALRPAVEQTQADVAEMISIARGLGGSGGSTTSTQPTGPSAPGGVEGCTFCDEDSVVAEGDVNLALGILQEVAGSLVKASGHILALPTSTGTAYNFNKSFACSYTGDAAIDIGSASLALGFPGNNSPQWRAKQDSSVFRLTRARNLAFCP